MFYHQKVARVRVFADIQNFALCAHCVRTMCTAFPQNQSYVGSSWQTLTTNVSMTLCSWQILSANKCLMWLHYIWYRIKLGTNLTRFLRPL